MCEILAKLAAPPILVFPDWNAVADGSRPFHVYCDACIDGFGPHLNRSNRTAQCGPLLTPAALPSILSGTGLRLTWKLAALSGPSNAREATYGARCFASSRITRHSKALAKWGITTRESSVGSSFSQRSTTPSSTAGAAPTEMTIFCPVCQSLPRNTTAVGLAPHPRG